VWFMHPDLFCSCAVLFVEELLLQCGVHVHMNAASSQQLLGQQLLFVRHLEPWHSTGRSAAAAVRLGALNSKDIVWPV
jgi:hypothetical protein